MVAAPVTRDSRDCLILATAGGVALGALLWAGGAASWSSRERPALEPYELRELPSGTAMVLPRRLAPL
jgi:hypothetical protein